MWGSGRGQGSNCPPKFINDCQFARQFPCTRTRKTEKNGAILNGQSRINSLVLVTEISETGHRAASMVDANGGSWVNAFVADKMVTRVANAT